MFIVLDTFISFLKDKNYRSLLISTLLVLTVGSTVYHYVEGWSWLDSVYFSLITLTTIGFGDFSPQTNAGKIFTIFYVIMGVGIILAFVNTIFQHFTTYNKHHKKHHKK